MFNIHLHLLLLCLVLSFKKVDSRNIFTAKSVYKTNYVKVVKPIQTEPVPSLSLSRMSKTGIITKLLIHKAKKFLLLSSFMLLAKPQVQNITEKEDISKKPKPVMSVKNNRVPYVRVG